jgi:hypothetical protein
MAIQMRNWNEVPQSRLFNFLNIVRVPFSVAIKFRTSEGSYLGHCIVLLCLYSFFPEFRFLSYHLTITIFRTPAVIPSFTRFFDYSLFTCIIQ